jgi:lysyl-tRNA synthetase class 2
LSTSEDTSKLELQRVQKRDQLIAMGIDPYGLRYDGAESAASAKARYVDGDDTQKACCAGRIVLLRKFGNLFFMTLRDVTGTIQIGLSKKMIGEQWDLAKLLEMGDIIACRGLLGKTKTEEITIWGEENGLTFLSKCLSQPPEKFHGLSDVDQRYRQRYVDLWANPEVMERFKARCGIINTIREYLLERNFLEVETPMMQSIAGGAAAKPFITHHNSLDIDLFLRISPELFLKRLLVGGMERVFEINRNFRNEGLSRRHNPEFTMIELYQAYGDYRSMMDLTEEVVCLCAERHSGGLQIEYDGKAIDLSRPWRRVTYADLLKEHAGCDIDDLPSVRAKARALGIEEAGMDDAVVINEVFEATVEAHLINPTFVCDYPAALCPLTRRKKDHPEIAERFELFVSSMELANAYSELNDPAIQEENFRIQLRGQQDTMATMDTDYVDALKYGMPPAGGLGIGIDRLVMVLTNASTIRDVVLFPLLKPKKIQVDVKDDDASSL